MIGSYIAAHIYRKSCFYHVSLGKLINVASNFQNSPHAIVMNPFATTMIMLLYPMSNGMLTLMLIWIGHLFFGT
jgi:hypothetical protein